MHCGRKSAMHQSNNKNNHLHDYMSRNIILRFERKGILIYTPSNQDHKR